MEFFVVPLLAIAAATFGIYKLTALVFHVHLTWRLLGLLVVFAWFISLVLPGLFFQSAGFMGSVGISLVSAVGFAWLATAYDTKTQASRLKEVSETAGGLSTEVEWTPPAEASYPVVSQGKSVPAIQEETAIKIVRVDDAIPQAAVVEVIPEQLVYMPQDIIVPVVEEVAPVEELIMAELVAEKPGEENVDEASEEIIGETFAGFGEEVIEKNLEQPMAEEVVEAIEEPLEELKAETTEEPAEEVIAEIVEQPMAEEIVEVVEEPLEELRAEATEEPEEVIEETLEQPMVEEVVEVVEEPQEELKVETTEEPEEVVEENIEQPLAKVAVEAVEEAMDEPIAEMTDEENFVDDGYDKIFVTEASLLKEADLMDNIQIDQPASESLEDLLDYAYEQRTLRNINCALDGFRLIRTLYGDSDALPMVVAEIVSTLQSQGNYGEAIAEVTDALSSPAIQHDKHATRIFEQKIAHLHALRDLLIEKGNPSLPFEQIPAEWSDLLEQRL